MLCYEMFFSTDKICDQISDAVLDAHLMQDPDAKVACGKCEPLRPERWLPGAGQLVTDLIYFQKCMQLIYCT